MNISRLEKIPLRDIWPHEATDFTQWLATEENIEILSDELGISITNTETEVRVGDFIVDILAEDDQGHKVVIENQLENTNHDHLGKLITYASGIDASIIVWIVANARQEHQQAITWLNENTTEDVNFFLIQMEAWRIGTSAPAPKFQVLAKPNDWAKVARLTSSNRELSESKLDQQRFWQELKDTGEKMRLKNIKSFHTPLPRIWYTFAIGRSGVSVNCVIHSTSGEISTELYIRENMTLFEKLKAQKISINNELGFRLDWQELEGRKASRAVIKKHLNYTDSAERERAIKWMLQRADIMVGVFRKRIAVVEGKSTNRFSIEA